MIKVDMEFNRDGLDKYRHALALGGEIQTKFDKMVREGIYPYVPYDTGALTMSALTNTIPGAGEIVWRAPYAEAVWVGKTPTGRNMQFDRSRNPLAGPKWAERYMADNSEKLRREIIKEVRRL